MKRTPTLILLFISFFLFTSFFTLYDRIQPNSPVEGWKLIKFDEKWNQEKWHEIPISIINGEVIIARTKKTDTNIDERKSAAKLYKLKVSEIEKDGNKELKPYNPNFLKGYQIKDVLRKDFDDFLYFTAKNGGKYELFKVDVSSENKVAEKVKFENNERYEILQPTLSRDGTNLVFVRKNRTTGYDLYKSEKNSKGNFGIPKKILKASTEYNETRPQYIYTLRGNEELIFTSNAIPTSKIASEIESKKNYTQIYIYLENAGYLEGEALILPINDNKKGKQEIVYSNLTHFDVIDGIVYEIRGQKNGNSVDVFYKKHESKSEKKNNKTRYFAYTIGINNFIIDTTKNLDNAIASQNLIINSLEKWNFRDVQTRHKINPTKKEILEDLNFYKDTLGSKDYLLVYISTHGYFDKKGVWYFSPSDGNEHDLSNTCISDHFLNSFLKDIDSEQVLFIIDACHANKIKLDIKSKGSNYDGKSKRILSIYDKGQKGLLPDKQCFAKWISNFLETQKDYQFSSDKLYQSLVNIGPDCFEKSGMQLIYGFKQGAGSDFIFRRKN